MTRATTPAAPARRGRVTRISVLLATAVLALAGAGPASGTSGVAALRAAVPTGAISGTVTSADGPVAGATVQAYTWAGVSSGTVTTAANGTYTFAGLPAGDYRVKLDGQAVFHSAEYYNDAPSYGEADAVAVTAGATTSGIDAVLIETGTISGTVTGPSGALAGVTVHAHNSATSTGATGTTNASGGYVLYGLLPGEYEVTFDGMTTGLVSEYYNNRLRFVDADPVTVTAGATTGGINATLAQGGGIAGTVTGPEGPAEGVWVYAVGTSTGYYEGQYTAADGTYHLVGLTPDTYRVTFMSLDGLVTELYDDALRWSDVDPVTVSAGISTPGIDAALVDGGSIAGTVRGPSGPIENAYVSVTDYEGGGQGGARTDSDGRYVVDGLPAGTYELRFDGPEGSGLRTEYYDNQITYVTAAGVALAAQQDRTGVDATLALVTDPLFWDVPHAAPFHEEVEWLAWEGIAGGYADGSFRPTAPVARQAMAAFLYRFAGEPDFTPPATASFSDVPVGSPFFTEVEWLASTGITTGYGDGTFRPTAPVARQAMAAFLYRYAEEPAFTPPATATFTDVPVGSRFFAEVEWLADTGITTGWPDHTFRPTNAVARQAMAAFLMRF